ncbi:MAG TPA: CBS domain-containing protein [Denitromonas sp.]|uniref:CBS domain-containing protein n=1 Tax=Denitromonas sp. TaxID=2734609 RepID=UPI001DF8CC20|nr:CBS domain-containing protein [Rhodocyclaceae bacterium]MCP5220127.1 CBS domain-containing protein [Zoogloeaceae bacterium]HQU87432.1 CBS domain-containing protein [Denitromonas sp.]HQV13398.1 CBS domain-containing protein [Denitromonas sp.]
MSASSSVGDSPFATSSAAELALPITALPAGSLLSDALANLADSPSHAVLAERDGDIIGILTERSALTLGLDQSTQPSDRRLVDVCQHSVLWADADENYVDVYERMLRHGVRHAIVRGADGDMVGLLSESAILGRMGIEHFAHLDAIEQIMTPRLTTVTSDTSVLDCADLMRKEHIGCVVVVSETRAPIGILTTRDVTRLLAKRDALHAMQVTEVMMSPAIQLEANRPVFEAARLMSSNGIRHVIVTQDAQLCGVVSEHDIVRCLEHRYVDVLRRVIHRQADELEAHRQVHAHTNMLDQLLSRSQELGLCLVEAEGRIGFINAAARALLNLAPDSPAGRLTEVLQHSSEQDRGSVLTFIQGPQPASPISIQIGERQLMVQTQTFDTDVHGCALSHLLILIDETLAKETGELLGFSRHAFGTMALPMMWADTEGCIPLSNAAFKQLAGYEDPGAAIHLQQIFDRADTPLSLPDNSNALRAQRQLIRADGVRIPVELFFSKMHFLGKHYLGGFIIDLSAQQAIEQALHDSEQRLDALLATSPDFIAVKDAAGRWQMANSAGLHMYGLSQTDWKEKTNSQLAAQAGGDMQDILSRCDNTDTLAWSRRESIRYIEEIPHTDAPGLRSLDMIKTPILDADQQPKALMVIGRDITERMHAESSRRESDERLHGALAGMDDLMLITDCGGVIQDHYPKPAPPRFQLPGAELTGLQVTKLLPSEAKALFDAAHEKLRSGLGIQQFDYSVELATQTHWFNVRMSRHRLANGGRSGMTLMIRDISASRKTAEQLERLKASMEDRVDERTVELKSALDELESFSYSLSHDLRAPLRAIDGFGRLLEQNMANQLTDVNREYLERIQAAVNRMSGLIDDMLDLARLSRKPVDRQPVDISRMARQVVAELSERDPERAVTWEIAHDLRAEADPILIQSVLDNLISNAWKFSRRVDAAHINVFSEQRDGQRWFVVEDNGAGFDMAYADKLFKPFQRLHSPRDFDGTGVGLATVHRIISRHGGQIEAESIEGQGARFRFSLGQ